MQEDIMDLVSARSGHFLLESGHHSDLWLDLELLFLQPKRVHPFTAELARRLAEYRVDAVCGPLIEGAFVGLRVAQELDVEFFYTASNVNPDTGELFPVKYRLPTALRHRIRDKRVAIVNDVINAGSAVRGTYDDLISCGGRPVVMATLLALGDSPRSLAERWNIDLITIRSHANSIWKPEKCAMCAEGRVLDNA